MIFSALSEAAEAGELLLVAGGLCRYHLRRDGTVTVREIIVLPAARRKGVGRALVAEVRRRHPAAIIRATCPAQYEANHFWRALGATVARYRAPKPGGPQLCEWVLLPH